MSPQAANESVKEIVASASALAPGALVLAAMSWP
jgi:hypothetical protein